MMTGQRSHNLDRAAIGMISVQGRKDQPSRVRIPLKEPKEREPTLTRIPTCT